MGWGGAFVNNMVTAFAWPPQSRKLRPNHISIGGRQSALRNPVKPVVRPGRTIHSWAIK
jgi:hypothetical protein